MGFDRRITRISVAFFQKRGSIYLTFNDGKDLIFPTWNKKNSAKIFTEEFKQLILEKTGAELP